MLKMPSISTETCVNVPFSLTPGCDDVSLENFECLVAFHNEVRKTSYSGVWCGVCPLESAATPIRFRPELRVPSLVGHLPAVSYVSSVSRWREDDDDGDMEWWGHTRHCTDFLAFALRLRKPRKTSVRKPTGALSTRLVIASNGVPFLRSKSAVPRYLLR